jgi:tRNA uridine 5-carboxymethylaminomethyl modification enzyme
LRPEVVETVETEIKFEGYIQRQIVDVEKSKNLESKKLPETFDYLAVVGLSAEARQKLVKFGRFRWGRLPEFPGYRPPTSVCWLCG